MNNHRLEIFSFNVLKEGQSKNSIAGVWSGLPKVFIFTWFAQSIFLMAKVYCNNQFHLRPFLHQAPSISPSLSRLDSAALWLRGNPKGTNRLILLMFRGNLFRHYLVVFFEHFLWFLFVYLSHLFLVCCLNAANQVKTLQKMEGKDITDGAIQCGQLLSWWWSWFSRWWSEWSWLSSWWSW